MFIVSFFFFQAEDGIRDTSVTGVQTCALPIFSCAARLASRSSAPTGGARVALGRARPEGAAPLVAGPRVPHEEDPGRSEERRVGKECRARVWRDAEREDREKRQEAVD